MAIQREDLIKLARGAVGGVHRPDDECSTADRTCPAAVINPAAYDPAEWVLEAMERAYNRGVADGARAAGSGLYPEAG